MQEMSLRDIQQISLSILKDVHNFCLNNNIRYILFGGTMIGAIRHKGFVPWDDDIDIAMPRPDYERFLASYKSANGYRLFKSGSHDCYLAFSRVCDMEQTFVENKILPWTNIQTGVWIDIFPLDAAPDNIDEAKAMIHSLTNEWKTVCAMRSSLAKFNDVKNYIKKVKLAFKKIVSAFPGLDVMSLNRKYINHCRSIEWGTTNHFANLSYMGYGMKEYEAMRDYQGEILVDFEDAQFYVCDGYDGIMRAKYGDYMKLPPVEKQTSNHELVKYYWK